MWFGKAKSPRRQWRWIWEKKHEGSPINYKGLTPYSVYIWIGLIHPVNTNWEMWSVCMQHAYANNTIARLAMLQSILCFPKLKSLNLLVADSGKKVQSKGTFTCSYARHGCHKFHESVPRIPKSAWKTLCKHETLEQDFKIRKRLYLFILARIKMLLRFNWYY